MADAIGRTLFRLFVSRRHLLEWVTGGPGDARPASDRRRLLSREWPAQCSDRRRRGALSLGAAGGDAWPVAPPFDRAMARVAGRRALGQPVPAGGRPSAGIARPTHATLRLIARRTWRYFETFVTPADHMLPPDNFQEDPAPVARAPDLADQYRPLSAFGRQRARLRLGREPTEAVERWRRRSRR